MTDDTGSDATAGGGERPAKATRTERDSMGELQVPVDALYGAQTQRAIENFPVSGRALPEAFVRALIRIKRAAALANVELGTLERVTGEAIETSCRALLEREDLMTHFPLDVYQTGSGTSTNMNANEVIARLASERLGRPVGANDDVNRSQSSNDTIPSAIHVSATERLEHHLLPALEHLATLVDTRAAELDGVCKTGRTHLMDAMPVTFGQVLGGWSAQLRQGAEDIRTLEPALRALAQGGTAVGTGVNADTGFADAFCRHLSDDFGLPFTPAPNPFAAIGSQDTAVALSGRLRRSAVGLTKIANDLRWMNSGPLAGLGEITLPALQPGSSIMPGKVNPVIPESAAMVAAQVIGNDAAIAVGGQSGNFELNVMLPLIAANLLDSIELLGNVVRLLADKAVAGFAVNEDRLAEALHRNPVLVTALNPVIGYERAAEIAKSAYRDGRPLIDVAAERTELSHEELATLLDPRRLTGRRAPGSPEEG